MNDKNKKILRFSIISSLMLIYIGWTFYISEPKYIDGIENKKVEVFDWVSIPDRLSSFSETNDVKMGIVLQVGKEKALVKSKGRYTFSDDEMIDINLNSGQYRIVGRGTIYHKVNHYVGFNIVLISQYFIAVFLLIITFTQISLISKIL
jgi:hypothetical protein